MAEPTSGRGGSGSSRAASRRRLTLVRRWAAGLGICGAATLSVTWAAQPAPTAGAAAVAPVAAASGARWSGDLVTGDLRQWLPLLASRDRATVYSASSQPTWPKPTGRYAVRLAANNADFRNPNVRAQLNGPNFIQDGDDVYFHWRTFFPADFPASVGRYPGFFVFASIYGYPFDGVGVDGAFGVASGPDGKTQYVNWSRSADQGYDVPWRTPLTRNRWHDFVFHVKVSRDAAVGFVEIWYDGVPQRLGPGGTRLYMSTIRGNNTQGLYPELTNYRSADSVGGFVTVYDEQAKVGSTYYAATH